MAHPIAGGPGEQSSKQKFSGGGGLREGSQLLQDTELVPGNVVFTPEAVLEAAHDDGLDLEGFPRRGNAHELSALCTRARAAPHHLVVIRDHVLDDKVEIGEGRSKLANEI